MASRGLAAFKLGSEKSAQRLLANFLTTPATIFGWILCRWLQDGRVLVLRGRRNNDHASCETTSVSDAVAGAPQIHELRQLSGRHDILQSVRTKTGLIHSASAAAAAAENWLAYQWHKSSCRGSTHFYRSSKSGPNLSGSTRLCRLVSLFRLRTRKGSMPT
ncbi:hypothetical protein C8034_v010115 [Colletotrichum sidae]|uniref:Uncharacterized protein n=1 Tax=Colletotrichum sidae TaxID=1347389 RepID=A0A4R8TJF5_9PEZI|nr:hypothetical protein C8034_v010115 [Colletotrichum sidae]